jgi:hypothetical protein
MPDPAGHILVLLARLFHPTLSCMLTVLCSFVRVPRLTCIALTIMLLCPLSCRRLAAMARPDPSMSAWRLPSTLNTPLFTFLQQPGSQQSPAVVA